MIALNKESGVWLVIIRETWRLLFSKCLMKVKGSKSTIACQDDKLCAGIDAVTDCAIHSVQEIWGANSSTEDWLFLLVDSKKAFNKVNRIGMLWTVFHLWPSRDRYVLNPYCHWSLLVFQKRNGTASFMRSREGVMQKVPLFVVTYGIGILLLIKNLKAGFPDVTQL